MRVKIKVGIIISITLVIFFFGCSINEPQSSNYNYIKQISPESIHRAPIDFIFEIADSNSLKSAVIHYYSNYDYSEWYDTIDIENIIDTISIHFDENSFIKGKIDIEIYDKDDNVSSRESFEYTDTTSPNIVQLEPIQYVYFPPCTLKFEIYDDFELYKANNLSDTSFTNYYNENQFRDTITFSREEFTKFAPYKLIAYDNSANRTELEYSYGPRLLDSLTTNYSIRGNFVVYDGYCFSAELNHGVNCYDLSQKSNVAKINYDNIYSYFLNIKDNYLIFADTLYSLLIYDIADKRNPKYINSLHLSNKSISDIEFFNDYALISNSSGEICIYDLSYLPQLYETTSFVPNLFKAVTLLYVENNYLYITSGYKLYIYDLSTLPANPVLIDELTIEEMISDLLVYQDNLVLTSSDCTYIYRLNNGTSPELTDTIHTHHLYTSPNYRASVLAKANDFCLVSQKSNSFFFNISNHKVDQCFSISSKSIYDNSAEIFGDTLFLKGAEEFWFYECQ